MLSAARDRNKNTPANSIPNTTKKNVLPKVSGLEKNGVTVAAVNQAVATVLRKLDSPFNCSELSRRTNLLYHFYMFGPKVVAEFDSKYSGKIRVMQGWGYKYVSTGFWTQSGGIIKDVWQPAFKKIHPQKSKTWLILGLATGTIAKLIPNPAKIVGVEIDPIMINIGRKYFALDQIPNLKIIIKNANDYLLTTNDYFDYVLVDLYCADQIPKFVYS
ncbi:MAG: hypothetical protein AAB877_01440, partial [Patescibacteria group bacterium]